VSGDLEHLQSQWDLARAECTKVGLAAPAPWRQLEFGVQHALIYFYYLGSLDGLDRMDPKRNPRLRADPEKAEAVET